MWFYFFQFQLCFKALPGLRQKLPVSEWPPTRDAAKSCPGAAAGSSGLTAAALDLSMVKLIHAHHVGSRSHFWIEPGAGCFFYKSHCCHCAKVTFAPSCLARTRGKSVGTKVKLTRSFWIVVLLPWGLSCRSGDSCLPRAFCIIVKC